MSEWFTVAEMSERTNIPQQTLRRYLGTHNHLFRVKKEHKSYQLHLDCESVLIRMRELYKKGFTSEQVDKTLTSLGMPTMIDVETDEGEMQKIEANDLFLDIKKSLDEQKEFNQQLLGLLKSQNQRLDDQERFIKEVLQKKDDQLAIALEMSQHKESDVGEEVLKQLKVQEEQLESQKVLLEGNFKEKEQKQSWFSRLFTS